MQSTDQLLLKVGAGVGTPAAGNIVVFADADGSVKSMTSDGTKAAIGGATTDAVTLGSNNVTIDLPITGGDGLYTVELDATVAGGGALGVSLRVNGSPLVSATGNNVVLRSSDNSTSIQADTSGTVLSTRSAFGATTVLLTGQISVRSGKLCLYSISGFGMDGSFRIQTSATGAHTPGAPLASIGVTSDGSFAAGSVLRATKSGS